jgi:hypothetical protein
MGDERTTSDKDAVDRIEQAADRAEQAADRLERVVEALQDTVGGVGLADSLGGLHGNPDPDDPFPIIDEGRAGGHSTGTVPSADDVDSSGASNAGHGSYNR